MMPNRKHPELVDCYVGGRVRAARMANQMSQEKLGDAIGVSFQQVQKYEHGTNRIGASRLDAIARNLNRPVAWFFEGAPQPAVNGSAKGTAEQLTFDPIYELARTKEGTDLARAFVRIKSERMRRAILAITETAAGNNNGELQ